MTRHFISVLAAACLAAATASAETVVKLASLAPSGSSYHDILLDLQREWADVSGGKVELRIYADGVAGDEADVIRKMRVGQLQAAIVTGGGLPDIDPGFRAFQVPMTYESLAELDHVLAAMRPTLDGLLARHGFRGLGWADAGWLYFFTRRPVVTPEDLKPQRIFVWAGADRLMEAWRDCGYSPVQLPATDIHTALQSGLIDAVNAPPLAALVNQWFASVPNMTTVRWVPLIAGFVITERAWRALPERLRPRLAAAADRAAERLRTEVRRDADKAIAIMQEHGLAVHAPTADELGLWQKGVRRCFEPLIGSYVDADLLRRVTSILDAYRASH